MLLSIANTTPRNIESVRVEDLLPSVSRSGAKNLVDLLEYYYDYLNTSGLPSAEIASISSLKDIDRTSLKYINQIKELIGKDVPSSDVMNPVELYKIIVKYYNTRGSEDSIFDFFKIFFNQSIELFYPKEFLFDLSGGSGQWIGDTWVYSDHKSFASDDYKIYDGHYWQDYSYVIRSDLDSSVWYDDYRRFVHPAGLKLFSAIVIEIVLRNRWEDVLDYLAEEDDDSWLQALIPPYNRNPKSIGFHTPKFQPGYLRDRFVRYIFMYLTETGFDSEGMTREVLLTLIKTYGGIDVRNSFVRSQYLVQGEMFGDPNPLCHGMLDLVISEFGEETYSNTSPAPILNFPAIITGIPGGVFSPGSYDSGSGDGSGDWEPSSFDDSGGDGSGDWGDSSYE